MGCNCGKKRMSIYSSEQATKQSKGETITASTTQIPSQDQNSVNNNTANVQSRNTERDK